jgi:cytochrome d ubiquinol oxidase subunit I
MVGAGVAMFLLAAWALMAAWRGRIEASPGLLAVLVPAIALPYISHSAGWIFTEIGRAPWIVFGLQTIAAGVSKSVTAGELLLTLIGFTLLYGVLMAADVYLLAKYAKAGVTGVDLHGGEHLTADAARI